MIVVRIQDKISSIWFNLTKYLCGWLRTVSSSEDNQLALEFSRLNFVFPIS